ncbi:hypothetical protein Rs2_42055 [Raphanus sativus]|nr:hypothetical protein Rs2_42055 [Raphanus sativus]
MNTATNFLVMLLFIGVLCTDVGARKLEKVSKELMDQKPLMLPPLPSTLPTPVIPPVPIPGLGEAVSATKGVENGVGMLSKDTKLGISIPKTAATNGVGTELVLTVTSTAIRVITANDNATSGPGGPGSSAAGRTYVSTSGNVTVDGPNPSAYSTSIANRQDGADGPNPSAYSTSIANRQDGADAEAGPDGAKSNGSSNGYAYTRAGGSIGNSVP